MWIDCDGRASKFFETIGTKEKTIADMLEQHKIWVRKMVSLKKRIKNPVNLKTGKPLAESTVNNFIKEVECIRRELKNYQPVIKWLRICGFWRGHKWKSELSPEQELIKDMLRDYVRNEKDLWKLRREHRSQKYWKERVEYYKDWADWWQKQSTRLAKYAMGELGEKPKETERPKKKSRVNDIGLKLLDGGKKLEEQPTFVT